MSKLHRDKIDSLLIKKLLKENSIELETLTKTKKGSIRKRIDKKSAKRIEAISLYSRYLEDKSNRLRNK